MIKVITKIIFIENSLANEWIEFNICFEIKKKERKRLYCSWENKILKFDYFIGTTIHNIDIIYLM